MTDITSLCAHVNACVCVCVGAHMNVFGPDEPESSYPFSGTSRAVTLCCADMILAVFKMECGGKWSGSGSEWPWGFWMRKQRGGVSVTFCRFSKHTMFFVLFAFLLHFLSTSFASIGFTCFIPSTLYVLSLSILSAFFTLSFGAGRLPNEGGSIDLGGGAVRQWLHASWYSAFHCWGFQQTKKSSDHAVHKPWNPLHRWLNESWMLWRNHAEGAWHLASCFRTPPLLFSFHFYL